ncbi:hypothetical protein AAG570_011623 [Ranatra chinensis]|uniref:Ras-GAP domain-containing protein n=1 Tax=Ranatra chinensis TaxID=642074 RepID=A0ABD0Z3D8_9HEMI
MENGSLLWDLIELAGHLRQERLFVLSEQTHLQELNEKVVTASSELAQVAWVTAQQRVNLNRLILSCPDATPATCCRRARALESTHFVDAHKILGYQNCSSYGELLQTLRDSPRLLAHCLLAGDRLIPDEMPGVVQSLIAGLYASCVLPQDKSIVLQVLSHLITLQLLPSEYPRRLLRQGSCAFSRLYSSFHEGLFSGKLFLTAALHSPILQLLMLEEKHLDIDPEKAIMRLSHDEKLRRFGVEGSEEYKLEVERHKRWTISNLVAITKNFISSLHDNLHCFPSAVCWLVGQIYARLTNSNKLQEREVFCMCTDVVFTMFVCPAIVTPEPYGIMDAPISAVARFNLIQVAQILQMLAMLKYQQVDPKVKDLYSQFDKDCVSSIIDSMIEGSIISDNPQVGDNMNLQGLCRSAALFTEAELHSLVSFLRTVANEANSEDTKLQKELAKLLRQIPEQIVNGHSKPNVSPDVPQKKHNILSKGKARAHNGNAFETSAEEEDVVGEKVLVIPFNTNTKPFVGLDSEQKIQILAMEKDANRTTQGAETDRQERAEGQEKRTRFSLSHDDGSIGNTSDNLEVVSEAPSNHSVASSLELETEDQNDNLSDMVSANVSGRGSPNISEGDEIGQVGTSTRQQLDFNPPPPPNKHSRFDIDEKFGKFEIKTLIEGADETVSLVSDTWSTDVLASDSETIEQPLLQAQLSLPDHQQLSGPQVCKLMDVSETASEAWSTDVVASDSERLTEVDTDDTASVARSDDTGRSEVESRGDPEAVEDPQSGQAS